MKISVVEVFGDSNPRRYCRYDDTTFGGRSPRAPGPLGLKNGSDFGWTSDSEHTSMRFFKGLR